MLNVTRRGFFGTIAGFAAAGVLWPITSRAAPAPIKFQDGGYIARDPVRGEWIEVPLKWGGAIETNLDHELCRLSPGDIVYIDRKFQITRPDFRRRARLIRQILTGQGSMVHTFEGAPLHASTAD